MVHWEQTGQQRGRGGGKRRQQQAVVPAWPERPSRGPDHGSALWQVEQALPCLPSSRAGGSHVITAV